MKAASPPHCMLVWWRAIFVGFAVWIFPAHVSGAIEDALTIEKLLTTGWQIAGFSQAFDNRSTFILFRQPDQSYLVQCRVGYDVTRAPSTYSICYKLQ